MQQHIDFPMEISVLKFHTWQFDGNWLFQIAFLNDQNTLERSPSHFLVVTGLHYHFMQSDLVGSGFLKA